MNYYVIKNYSQHNFIFWLVIVVLLFVNSHTNQKAQFKSQQLICVQKNCLATTGKYTYSLACRIGDSVRACYVSPGSRTWPGFQLISPLPSRCPLLFISSQFTSFSLFSLTVTLYLSVCLSVSLVHFLLLGLNTFEKKGLPSYLGHGIKVTGASVWSISSQPDRGKEHKNILTYYKLCSSQKRSNSVKWICIQKKCYNCTSLSRWLRESKCLNTYACISFNYIG